jgi:hypothetical protein
VSERRPKLPKQLDVALYGVPAAVGTAGGTMGAT